MSIKVALAGNPNCGKTTLFNLLTGSNQYVGNWPGVTVEKKEGKLKGHSDVTVVDLPGIYSLSPYTLEEVVARKFLLDENPDVILNIVDGTNLERNLYLTTQLVELGIPTVMAINMMDVVRKNGDNINSSELSKEVGCAVVEISALKGNGIDNAINEVLKVGNDKKKFEFQHRFADSIESVLTNIENEVLSSIPEDRKRWYAVKVFEGDEKVVTEFSIPQSISESITSVEDEFDDDAESIITNERYTYISSIIGKCYKKKNKGGLTTSDKIDQIVTNRFLALPIFAVVMFIVYYISVTTVGTILTDATNGFFEDTVAPAAQTALENANCAEWLTGLIVDGIIGGVGAVLGFVPQMLVLFLFLGFLEGCGYMARIAFVMDRIFRKFGLSGKSFIPMLIGTGCGVPGVMASRTIENERDRRMTIMTTTFIPCGAKLPIIALIAGALFDNAGWVATSCYFVGVVAIITSGIMLKKFKIFSGEPAPFVMELPSYHMPTVNNLLHSVWERAWSFIKKAGTIILISSIILWALQAFGVEDGSFGMVEDLENSILASIGNVLAPIFKPLGFGNWKSAVAVITGLIAKENVVATFGVLYGGLDEVAEDGNEIWEALRAVMTPLQGYAFLVFNLLCAPCFAAIGAIKREMNNGKWTVFAIAYQCVFAYIVSLIIYQVGSAIQGNLHAVGFVVALILIAMLIFLLVRPYNDSTKGSTLSVEKAMK